MKTVFTALLIAGGILTAQASFADERLTPEQKEKAREALEARFAQADTNDDGMVTRDEAKGIMPRLYRNFDKIDLNHNGAVTLDEIRQAATQLRQTHPR